MKQQTFSTPQPASSYSVCSLPAQSVDAIITHFTQGVMAGEEWLPSGNYTITAIPRTGGQPHHALLRFQSEDGASRGVMAVRDGFHTAAHTQVQLAADRVALRVTRVIINGSVFAIGLIC